MLRQTAYDVILIDLSTESIIYNRIAVSPLAEGDLYIYPSIGVYIRADVSRQKCVLTNRECEN